jgi:hypothetical protein
MIALIYLVFFALYGLVSFLVIRKAYGFARVRYKKGWVGGWLAALVMYNLVFWDWIPVYVMHKHYCSTEAGFWVYKSPEQWIKENPETVGGRWGSNYHSRPETIEKYTSRYWSSNRVYMDITQRRIFDNKIGRTERVLVDNSNGEVLARAVEFYRGGVGSLALGAKSISDYKIWLGLGHRHCGPISAVEGFMDLSNNNRYKLEQLGKGGVND